MGNPAQENSRKRSAQLLPALIAGSACGLISAQSSALQLGDLEIQSTLGQSLRASIAFALGPNEQLLASCVRLRPRRAASGLPILSGTNLSIADGKINLTSSRPVGEPMFAVQLVIDCPYTMNLTRSYTVMLDPIRSTVVAASASSEQAVRPVVRQRATINTIPAVIASAPSASTAAISLGTNYRVQVGDTATLIASRIENRSVGIWPAANAIFSANPDAFVDRDINRLRAGSELIIPAFDGATAATQAEKNSDPITATNSPEPVTTAAYAGYVPDETSISGESVESPAANILGPQSFDDSGMASADVADTGPESVQEIQPGDIAFGNDAAFVSPITSSAEAPIEAPIEAPTEAPIEAPINTDIPLVDSAPVEPPIISQPAPADPIVSTRSVANTTDVSSGSWIWLYWLAGAVLSMILGFFAFGRKVRDRFGSQPIAPAVDPVQPDLDVTALSEAIRDVDFQFDDELPTPNDYTLDADLGAGTGLGDSCEIDVIQDFGIPLAEELTADLDMVLPEAVEAPPESSPTDILPPQRIEESSILDLEVMPNDDDYDMSMIVDVTRQNIDETHSTERDLKAVPIDELIAEIDDNEYTLDQPVGVEILEKDYEEEFTATQAANEEIEKAARDLALRMDESEGNVTAEMPASDSVATRDLTAELAVQMPGIAVTTDDEFSALDDTGINEELTAKLPTAENDATVEMEVESGRASSK